MAVTEPSWVRILEELRASRFRDLAGARVTATLPFSEPLLNNVIAASLPRFGTIREMTVRPQPHDRVGVRVKLARPEFLPPISATLVIERQPELPQAPFLVFRITGLPGLLALAGPFLSLGSKLPPEVRVEGDLLTVDLAALLGRHGYGEWLGYLERLRVTSEAGRLVVDFAARSDERPTTSD